MNNNKPIEYKNSVFDKIVRFFKKLFLRKQTTFNNIQSAHNMRSNVKYTSTNQQTKQAETREDVNVKFINSIKIKEDTEEIKIRQIKRMYEAGEIDAEDLSEEDCDKLCDFYKRETEILNADTERRKKHIVQMLKELKNT